MTPFFTPITKGAEKVYISGPMTGYPDNNFEAFDRVAQRLRLRGFSVCSPADTSRYLSEHTDTPLTHAEYLRFDFDRVLEADQMVVLQGWEWSKGALAEIHVALRLGIPVYRELTLYEITEEIWQEAMRE